MEFLKTSQVHGNQFRLLKTDPRHLDINGQAGEMSESRGGFQASLINALDSVNKSQIQSADLTQQLITDPDSVDVHDVTIALAEANMTLSLTKQVVDTAVKAYREITSLR